MGLTLENVFLWDWNLYWLNTSQFHAVAEAAYQVDPTHMTFIKKAEHLWKKVIVYDATPIDTNNLDANEKTN